MISGYLARKREHDELARQMAEFEAKGGMVQKIPAGEVSIAWTGAGRPLAGTVARAGANKRALIEQLIACKTPEDFIEIAASAKVTQSTIVNWRAEYGPLSEHMRELGLTFAEGIIKKRDKA